MSKTKNIVNENEIAVEERTVNGFICENHEKWNRAVYGSTTSRGALVGGVGEHASDAEKLANYDKLGGRITKGGRLVKTGSFYDFKKQTPKTKPEVFFLFKDINGNTIEIAEGEEVPIEVRAAEIAEKNKVEKKPKSSKKKVEEDKPNVEDEE